MKKLFIAVSFLAASFAVNAQDTNTSEGFTSKNGHQVLPEAGDIGLSFNATPFLNYFGNLFNSGGTNSLNTGANGSFPGLYTPSALPVGTLPAAAISGKYFLDAKTAIRARVQIGLQSNTSKTLVAKVGSTSGELVEDKTTTKSSQVYLSAGIEKRRGSSRIQGYYGAELIFGILSNPNVKKTYGNALSSSNTNGGVARTLETKNGNTLAFGPRGFIGAEYFFAPKFSLGAEFGWGILLSSTAKSEVTTETWNGTAVDTKTSQTTSGPTGINLNTDNLSGAINLNLYF